MLINSYEIDMETESSFVQEHQSLQRSAVISENLNAVQTDDYLNINQTSHSSLIYDSIENMSDEDKLFKSLLELLLEYIDGRKNKVDVYPFDDAQRNKNYSFNPSFFQGVSATSQIASYESTETYYQKSAINFSSNAQINTSNGSFNIDLNLSFSQEFYEKHKTKIDVAQVTFQDPLVINFDGPSTFDNISQNMSFEFDLNNDGEKEELPLLKGGSGFLALDKNNNGEIDSGNELFGPNTNDGFEELSQYDEDGNNWIDEADSIYNSLKIWQINEEGENKLISLSQAGVGAIYLSSIGSNFNYSKGYGDQTASLDETSIFLKENGEAGIITSVDLAV